MKIKIKDPKLEVKRWDRLALHIGLTMAAFWIIPWLPVFSERNSPAQLLFFIFMVIAVIAVPYLSYRAYRIAKYRRETDPVTVLDFQPDAVLLQNSQKRLLPYKETTLKLIIHIGEVPEGKTYQVGVHHVSFLFQIDDTQLCVEHLVTLKELFPILEQLRRFTNAAYRFQLDTSWVGAKEYQKSLEELVEDHLRYGMHLPLKDEVTVGAEWTVLAMGGVLILSMCLVKTTGVQFEHPKWLFLLGCGVVIVMEAGIKLVLFYCAKRKRNKLRAKKR